MSYPSEILPHMHKYCICEIKFSQTVCKYQITHILSIFFSFRKETRMQTFINIFLGFFIFKSVGAVPITDTIIYDSEFYDIPLGELPHSFAYDEKEQSDQLEVIRTLFILSFQSAHMQWLLMTFCGLWKHLSDRSTYVIAIAFNQQFSVLITHCSSSTFHAVVHLHFS